MTKKKTPKPKLAVIQGGKVAPSVHSVEGLLQTAIEKHGQRRYAEIYIVGVRPGNSSTHSMDVDIMHHSKDRVRMLGVLTWALERFRSLYLPPVR